MASEQPDNVCPQIRAIQKCSAELVKALSAADQLMPWKLLAKELIGQDIIEYCQLEVTQTKKSSKIVCSTIETVSASPHLFESLLSVLSESGNTALMSVGENLKQTYESIKELLTEKPCHHHSFHTHSHHLPTTSSVLQSPICRYANYLRAIYTRSDLPEYSNPACYKWISSPGKKFKFINLAVISKEEMTEEESVEIRREIIHGHIDVILKKKAPVAIENILQVEQGQSLTCVLIEGAPGIGKSMLAWEICRHWGRGQHFQEYSIVLLVTLRDERVQRAICVVDLFYHNDKKLQEEVVQEIGKNNGKETLILLEGLDELPEHLLTECSLFTDLLSGVIFPEATILVTSRPSATDKLWQRWWQKKSRHIEILGFNESNIDDYSKSVLMDHQHLGFNSYLTMHPHIKLMMYVPLHCAIATAVYLQCQQLNKPPPQTITGLYTCLTQTILMQYLQDHPDYKEKKHFISFAELPPLVYTQFKRLCRLAFDGIDKQQLVFHNLPQLIDSSFQQFDHLGFMDAVPELFLESASFSYNFLHLSIQEYLAAYHVSLMTTTEQEQLLETVKYGDHRFNMTYFLAGITQLKHLDKELVNKVIGMKRNWGRKIKFNFEDLLFEFHTSHYTLEFLYECQDVSILDNKCCYYTKIQSTDSVHCLTALGYCIAMSDAKWHIIFLGRENIGTDVLCHSLKENPRPAYRIEGIEFRHCTLEFTCQVLQHLPKYALKQIKEIFIEHADTKPLPPCLPELIKMERLNTLTLENVLDTSLIELIPALSKVPTLRNLTLHKVNLERIAVLCQWLSTCHLKTLTLHEKIETRIAHKIKIFIDNNFIEAIKCKYCTTEFIDQILPQIPQQFIAHVKTLTICNEYEKDTWKRRKKATIPAPSCLSEMIPRMERLNTLTLKDILDTSLTEVIPALYSVPTLRKLTLPDLNSEGIALLCQWLHTCKLKELLIMCEENYHMKLPQDKKMSATFSNNSIEAMEFQFCTLNFTDQVLLQMPKQLLSYVRILVLIINDYNYIDNEYHRLKPLPPCLQQLIPRMERLHTLTLKNVLDSSLIELLLVLSRVPTLRNLTLHKLNSEGITILCKWLPQCQLEKLIVCEQIQYMTIGKMTLNFSIKAIEYHYCTAEFIDQILSQMPQQFVTYVQALTIYNDDHNIQMSPSCLPELMPRMERLNTLVLYNVTDFSLTELIPVFSRISTLRHLTLPKLNSEGFALLCQWLPTCQLEKLKSWCLSPDHIEMVSRALITVSSLKILDISLSKFNFQSMQAFVFMLQQIQSLTEVNISNSSINSESAYCLAKALHHDTTLRILDIRGNRVGKGGAEAMAEMLKHNIVLEELIFTNAKISNDDAIAMALSLHHNKALRKLDISWNPIGEMGALAMAAMLKHNTTLEELYLKYTEISSDGTVAVAEALQCNTTLRKLDIEWNQIGERGALAMAEMLKHNTTLEMLNLSDTHIKNKIGDKGINALVECLALNQQLQKLEIASKYKKFVTKSIPLYSAHKERVYFIK